MRTREEVVNVVRVAVNVQKRRVVLEHVAKVRLHTQLQQLDQVVESVRVEVLRFVRFQSKLDTVELGATDDACLLLF